MAHQNNSNFEMLMALNEAKYFYDHSQNMDAQQRFDSIVSLAEWGIFSMGHLSQISGYSTSTVHGMADAITRKPGSAGRFNPKSLDTLIQLRLNYNNKLPLNVLLLRAAVEDGNSYRMISRLTGIPLSTLNRKLNVQDSIHLQ